MFLWAYFAQLVVSSLLNLGLERLTARDVGVTPRDAGRIVGAALCYRLVSAPLTALGLGGTFLLVGVDIPPPAFVAVLAWTLVVQAQGVVFAGMRARGDVNAEAVIVFGSRAVQAGVLELLAIAGAGPVALLGALAAIDGGGLVVALLRLRPSAGQRLNATQRRLLATYTMIELLGFAYLRADLLIAGRLLGQHAGATYGLAYRVLDAMAALLTPTLLVLFPAVAALTATRGDFGVLHRRLMAIVSVGALIAGAAILLVPLSGVVSPRLEEATPVLRLLLASVPITFAVGIEIHVASASGENAKVAQIGALVLVANIVGNLVVVPRFGAVGAALVLNASEGLYAIGLSLRSSTGTRIPMLAIVPATMLLTGAALLNHHATPSGIALCLAVVAGAAGSTAVGFRSQRATRTAHG